ncbi:MAG TPA: FkbM family methyltransferase [Spirochaetota bacterium]|nr:FkbM family methyltransferase [Spirochaetota bacterium]
MQRLIRNVRSKAYRILLKPIMKIFMGSHHDLVKFPPNYIYFDRFNEDSIVLDVGCGNTAEFSLHFIDKYNLKAYGVDPTRKHAPYLKILEDKTKGKFCHINAAITAKEGFVEFYESKHHESGSTISNHYTIQTYEMSSYRVESINLDELIRRIGAKDIDILKLDIEGAEYDLLKNITDQKLMPFKQLFIEFHFHCTNHTFLETILLVRKICKYGYKVATLDYKNYLFYNKVSHP